jgi:hypothetical protein
MLTGIGFLAVLTATIASRFRTSETGRRRSRRSSTGRLLSGERRLRRLADDEQFDLSANDKAVYSGTGVIYVDGTVTAANGARLCAGSLVSGNCPSTWNTTTNNVELVAINHQNAANAVSFVGDAQVQGIVFANGNFSSTNGASIYGSVIADSGQPSGNAQFASPPQPPAGAPGAATTTTTSSYTWNVPKGGWSQY